METIELVDQQGVPRLRIDSPAGKDATGRALRAGKELRFELDGRRLSLSADLTEAQFPVVIDPSWSTTGGLAQTRYHHASATLANGRVLVIGGYVSGGSVLDSCELYDPASKTWSAAGSLSDARYSFPATVLANGTVLVGGGLGTGNSLLSSCEVYDPAANTWSSADSLDAGRSNHTATLLQDGRVLTAAGSVPGGAIASCEVYDPGANSWSAAGDVTDVRGGHTATLLEDGRVLVTGGTDGAAVSSCKLYDPASNTWSSAGNLTPGRAGHAAVLLGNGKVLVSGGYVDGSGYRDVCELYNPSSNTWSAAGSLDTARAFHSMTLLGNGKVLAAGGQSGPSSHVASCELYDLDSNAWSGTGSLATGRASHTANLLKNGDVLVSAGLSGSQGVASCELYVSTTPVVESVSPNVGPVSGGTQVTINGFKFGSGATVKFGGSSATNVSVNSANEIECTTPNHAEGTVDVVVTNPGGESNTLVDGFTYTTNNPPIIDSGPNTSDANVDVGVEVTFTVSASDPDGDPVTYAWDFGDGNTATGENAAHTYTSPGTYTVKVTVTDDKGASVSDTLTQIVRDPDGVTITRQPTAEPPVAVVGTTVTFFVKAESPASPITYTWDFGDGSAAENTQNLDVTHVYAAAGNYTAMVTATDNNGKTATANVSVTITVPGGGGLESGVLKCKTVKLRLNFKKENKDMVSVKGTIEIPAGFSPEGAEVHVNISGVFGSFVLDAKGKAKTDVNGDKNKKFMIKLKFKKGELQAGEAKFTMTFKNGNFQDMWAEYGAVNEDIDQKIGIPVTITTSTHVYTDALVGDYRARQDRSGKFAGKEGLTIGGGL